MLCILRLSLTREWFGFTFLWSPAGRCLCGALPIAGTRPPSLSPNVPLHPHLHHLASLPHTHTHRHRGFGRRDLADFQPQGGRQQHPAAGHPGCSPASREPRVESPTERQPEPGLHESPFCRGLPPAAGDCHQLQGCEGRGRHFTPRTNLCYEPSAEVHIWVFTQNEKGFTRS